MRRHRTASVLWLAIALVAALIVSGPAHAEPSSSPSSLRTLADTSPPPPPDTGVTGDGEGGAEESDNEIVPVVFAPGAVWIDVEDLLAALARWLHGRLAEV